MYFLLFLIKNEVTPFNVFIIKFNHNVVSYMSDTLILVKPHLL